MHARNYSISIFWQLAQPVNCHVSAVGKMSTDIKDIDLESHAAVSCNPLPSCCGSALGPTRSFACAKGTHPYHHESPPTTTAFSWAPLMPSILTSNTWSASCSHQAKRVGACSSSSSRSHTQRGRREHKGAGAAVSAAGAAGVDASQAPCSHHGWQCKVGASAWNAGHQRP